MTGNEKSGRDVSDEQARMKPETAGLNERLQAHIGVQLKSMYDAYLNEPIPDRIVELLEQLDRMSTEAEKERGQETGK